MLDPFCGCATSLVAAELEYREWVGIDIWKRAHKVVLKRLKKEYFEIEGDTGEKWSCPDLVDT